MTTDADPASTPPDPRRPRNRRLLFTVGLLMAGWLGFLLYLAVKS